METVTEQPTLHTEEVCCGAELQSDYNCAENYCELTLATCSLSWSFCCKGCAKYEYYYPSCEKDACRLFCLIKFPFTLIADICVSPCKTFLYCEKCVSKKENKKEKMGTEPGL